MRYTLFSFLNFALWYKKHNQFCSGLILYVFQDIYNLWTSPYSHLLPARLSEYFPNLLRRPEPDDNDDDDDDDSSRRPHPRFFYHGFSPSELGELYDTETACLHFLQQANAWDIKREADLKRLGLSEESHSNDAYQRDFADAFKSNVDIDLLLNNIDSYLNRVQKHVNTLENIFADNQ